MESFDAEADDKRGQQVLFNIFQRTVSMIQFGTRHLGSFYRSSHQSRWGIRGVWSWKQQDGGCAGDRNHREVPGPLPQREPVAGGHLRDGGPRADGIHPHGQVPACYVQVNKIETIHFKIIQSWIQDNTSTKVSTCLSWRPAGGLPHSWHGELGSHRQGEADLVVHRGGGGLQPGGDDRVL